jgi:Legionella pneumophila major outer membrane protein precursor
MHLKCFLSNIAKTCLAIGALSVSPFAGADEFVNYAGNGPTYSSHYSGSPYYNGSPCCSSPCDSCCGMPINPAPDCGWGYNPPAYPKCGCCEPCNDGFLESLGFRADFLWWRASQAGLDLGVENTVVSKTNTFGCDDVLNITHRKKPNFKYDPGFRIGFLRNCACDCWDFAVNWTSFHSKAQSHGFANCATDTIFVPFFERLAGLNPSEAVGRHVIDLDWVDIEFGRKFYVSNCFILRPQFGLRIARIHQNLRAHYFLTDSFDLVGSPFSSFDSNIKARSNFLAVGPRVGLDLELRLGCGLSLFGCTAGTVAFGQFDTHAREFFSTPCNCPTNPGVCGTLSNFEFQDRNRGHRDSRAILDIAFGVKWDRCFEWCGRHHPVSLAFAWEHHSFFAINNFNFGSNGFDINTGVVETTAPGCCGDLFLQGLTITLAFGF